MKVAASLASLVSLLRGMASDDVDPEEVGADWAARMQTGLERTMEVRSALPDEEERVLDLYFKDFMTDPITSVRAVYRHWGRSLSDEAEGRMRAHLSENPRGKYGRHEYTLDGYGMNLEDERKRFDRYQSRYAIPEETT